MRSISMPPSPADAVGGGKSIFLTGEPRGFSLHLHKGIEGDGKPLRNGSKRKWRKNAVLCFRDMNSGLGNIAESLQQLGARLSNPEQYAEWGESLKRNVEKIEVGLDDRRKAFWEVTNIPFGKSATSKESEEEEEQKPIELDLPFLSNRTVDVETPKGDLSAAAVSSIEQFSRLNGVTAKKMKAKFYSDAPAAIHDEARNLVEYCCLRYLSRFSTQFHPLIKEASFRRLIFITMLAWQQPYADPKQGENEWLPQHKKLEASCKTWVVREDAFVRIAPAVGGVADKSTAHNLFKSLTQNNDGLSLKVWDRYLRELARVHEKRVEYTKEIRSTLELGANESVLYVAADKRQPVQMWNKIKGAWPGRLTLTDRALYFEPNAVVQHWKPMKLDLGGGHGYVRRKKVGPFAAEIFDSAIEVTPSVGSESWVLEFVDFPGEGLRELWFAFVNELLATFSFIEEYGPASDDPFVRHVYGSEQGFKKAILSAVNGILRVQAVQATVGGQLRYVGRLLQFSFLVDAPSGELVKQALAVNFWGGNLQRDHKSSGESSAASSMPVTNDTIGTGLHLVDVDGSVYLQRWMKSPTWAASKSTSFWKHKAGSKGLIIGKELVVGDLTYTDRAIRTCKEQSQVLENTRATIDGALVKGIPSNIDLLKELMLPFTILSINFRRLQKWEDPHATMVFLATCSLIIYKRWLRFLFPASLLVSALCIFTVHNLKAKGRLGDGFGRVTIREPPPSNTLQKILALKEALAEVEIQIQKANIALLKIRSLILFGHPQSTHWLILALVGTAMTFLFVPFGYICAFVLIDQFTCELDFRRGMVLKLVRQVNEWWEAIPAVSVVVLPHQSDDEKRDTGEKAVSENDEANPSLKGEVIAEAVREWFAESF